MNPVLMIQENPLLIKIYRKITFIVKMIPFYLVKESLQEGIEMNLEPKLSPLEVAFLKPDEMKFISENPEVDQTEARLKKQLADGCLCLGIKYNDEIAAYTWCDLNVCQYKSIIFPLKKDEALLFDARTFKKFRGKNLAPFLRYQLYKHLVEMGRTQFYSITIMSNTSSTRFKEKLGGKIERLYLYIGFFETYHFNVLIKSYR